MSWLVTGLFAVGRVAGMLWSGTVVVVSGVWAGGGGSSGVVSSGFPWDGVGGVPGALGSTSRGAGSSSGFSSPGIGLVWEAGSGVEGPDPGSVGRQLRSQHGSTNRTDRSGKGFLRVDRALRRLYRALWGDESLKRGGVLSMGASSEKEVLRSILDVGLWSLLWRALMFLNWSSEGKGTGA